MRTYTRDELAALLGIDPTDFHDAVTVAAKETNRFPTIYRLNTPIDVGERKPAQYVLGFAGRGFGLFPTLASARLWNLNCDYWEPDRLNDEDRHDVAEHLEEAHLRPRLGNSPADQGFLTWTDD